MARSRTSSSSADGLRRWRSRFWPRTEWGMRKRVACPCHGWSFSPRKYSIAPIGGWRCRTGCSLSHAPPARGATRRTPARFVRSRTARSRSLSGSASLCHRVRPTTTSGIAVGVADQKWWRFNGPGGERMVRGDRRLRFPPRFSSARPTEVTTGRTVARAAQPYRVTTTSRETTRTTCWFASYPKTSTVRSRAKWETSPLRSSHGAGLGAWSTGFPVDLFSPGSRANNSSMGTAKSSCPRVRWCLVGPVGASEPQHGVADLTPFTRAAH